VVTVVTVVTVKKVKKVNHPVLEDVWPMVTLLILLHSVEMPIQPHVLLWMGKMDCTCCAVEAFLIPVA
jgi:hypothetical protein